MWKFTNTQFYYAKGKLNDESELVRNTSAEALRKIGTPEALKAVEEYGK